MKPKLKTNYINEIQQRIKKCKLCTTPFLDLTKSNNQLYCSKSCREYTYNHTQTKQIWRHQYYLRKIKPTQRLLQQTKRYNYFIGTITKKDLDKRINHLLSISLQQQRGKPK